MRRFRFSIALLLLCALHAVAQETAVAAPSAAEAPTQITLGHSMVALYGPWKFHIGDNPAWADPNFDDSQWETVDLTPKAGSIDPDLRIEGYTPGWTAKGHAGYAGFAWYRIRIHVTGADGPLALLGPANFDDSYQIFINGRLLGAYGKFDRRTIPTVYYSSPVMFALPAGGVQHGTDAAMVVAFRFYMDRQIHFYTPTPGGFKAPPFLGLASAVTAAYHVAWEVVYRALSPTLAVGILHLLFALLILMLYVFDRTETILLLPLSACVLGVTRCALIFFMGPAQVMTVQQQYTVTHEAMNVSFALWLLTWWAYFGLQDRKWIRNTISVLVLWEVASPVLLDILLFGGHISYGVLIALGYATSTVDCLLVISIAYFGWRRPQRPGWALFLALFFYVLSDFYPFLYRLHIPLSWRPFGIPLNAYTVSEFASLSCFSFVLLRRFRSSQRLQQAMEEDVQKAQQVQQVLIPEALPHISGLTIESEYRPARVVGGDFFQIIPDSADGSVLIVVGDVTGHGLQAGMLVALIVGAIRNQTDTNFDPLHMLQSLNKRLCGRGEAHATCLALRIAADGAATLANAGHLPPYLNGKELPMEGAMLLGMIEGAEFSVMHFQLHENDRLILMSDGIAEAQDAHGQLFGFERIQALLQKPITAAELATAAQDFGQQDDISVLRIVRAVQQTHVLSPEPALAMGDVGTSNPP